MKYTTEAYKITCKTNLHVGSGDANFGVVDNLVQRDPITHFPIINASSLKGALRQHFSGNGKMVEYIFGADPTRNNSDAKAGAYRFFPADLLAYPIRKMDGDNPYQLITTQSIIDDIEAKGVALGIKKVDLGEWNTETLSSFNQEIKHLPVIARNQLENGESKNLWYEEVVPRESQFVFFVARPTNDKNDVYQEEWQTLNKETVQIGANASIGYGFCEIEKLQEKKKEDEPKSE